MSRTASCPNPRCLRRSINAGKSAGLSSPSGLLSMPSKSDPKPTLPSPPSPYMWSMWSITVSMVQGLLNQKRGKEVDATNPPAPNSPSAACRSGCGYGRTARTGVRRHRRLMCFVQNVVEAGFIQMDMSTAMPGAAFLDGVQAVCRQPRSGVMAMGRTQGVDMVPGYRSHPDALAAVFLNRAQAPGKHPQPSMDSITAGSPALARAGSSS